MNKKYIFYIIFIAVLFVSCYGGDEQDYIFDRILAQIQENNQLFFGDDLFYQLEEGVSTDENNDTTQDEGLYGNLTILVGTWLPWVQELFITPFQRANPNVNIIINTLSADLFTWSVHDSTALMTQLLANPPDIFIPPSVFSYEGVVLDALFLDKSDLIDGSHGINRDDFFDNVLRAAEIREGLFHIPLMIGMNLITPSSYHFERIGVDLTGRRGFTIDEMMNYYFMASSLYSGNLLLTDGFHIGELFLRENVYDIGQGEVFVYTPEMRTRLLTAMNIPINPAIEFTPTELDSAMPWSFGGFVTDFANTNRMFRTVNIDTGAVLYLAAEHPRIRFSTPVHHLTTCGDAGFTSNIAMSIMRGSQNTDLAWEFIRFGMEYTGGNLSSFNFLHGTPWLPINRARFDALVYEGVIANHRFFNTHWDTDVNDAYLVVKGFRGLMEELTIENHTNRAVFNSLIYTDLYLLWHGRQDVDTTLRNIQRRLELFVNE